MPVFSTSKDLGPADIETMVRKMGLPLTRVGISSPCGHGWHQIVEHIIGGGCEIITARSEDRGDVVAIACLSFSVSKWNLEMVTDQTFATLPVRMQLESDLFEIGVESLSQESKGQLELWIATDEVGSDRVLERQMDGLPAQRQLVRMRRRLPAERHDGLPARPFRVGIDEADFVRLNNSAFAGHPDQGGWEDSTLLAMINQPWFDPDGLLLYEQGNELAGFAWTRVHSYCTPAVGEVRVLGVRRESQGKGIGKKLLVTALDYLSSRGLSEVVLYVDSANLSAFSLYAGNGFIIEHSYESFVIEL